MNTAGASSSIWRSAACQRGATAGGIADRALEQRVHPRVAVLRDVGAAAARPSLGEPGRRRILERRGEVDVEVAARAPLVPHRPLEPHQLDPDAGAAKLLLHQQRDLPPHLAGERIAQRERERAPRPGRECRRRRGPSIRARRGGAAPRAGSAAPPSATRRESRGAATPVRTARPRTDRTWRGRWPAGRARAGWRAAPPDRPGWDAGASGPRGRAG